MSKQVTWCSDVLQIGSFSFCHIWHLHLNKLIILHFAYKRNIYKQKCFLMCMLVFFSWKWILSITLLCNCVLYIIFSVHLWGNLYNLEWEDNILHWVHNVTEATIRVWWTLWLVSWRFLLLFICLFAYHCEIWASLCFCFYIWSFYFCRKNFQKLNWQL